MIKLLKKDVLLEYNFKSEEVTNSGIILDHREPDLQTAKILYTGVNCEHVKPGDEVYFKRAVAHRITIENTEYLMLNEGLILGIKL